ncbi:MAG: AAA family ATPase [Acidobacteriota bacterium]|nr:AAA family ATPase [Acidobacteriota bacterium]
METKSMQLQSVRIQRFKRIKDASIDLKTVNVFVGGNNSGKSSLIQALHFGVGLLQTIALSGQWKATTSLNPTQLIYSPAEDIHALGQGAKLFEDADEAITLEFNLVSGESCSVNVRKGRNRNILIAINNTETGKLLSSLERPFSVFSPGLAGITKREAYVSDGVLLRTLARGDANLILRNILFRLRNLKSWDNFLEDLRQVFPQVEIEIQFAEKTAEVIDVSITTDGQKVPLEIAGTGVLQALQILSYIHLFSPSMVVLDEPDSHLHPNNQRLLCALLTRVSQDRGTQILLTTHSRHVVDALTGSAALFWVRRGLVDVATADDEIGILLDIGALDIKERVGHASNTAIVLTEDELPGPLESVLVSSGFEMGKTVLLPYYGVTGMKQLRPLVKMIRSTNPSAKIILHRDRDFLTDIEIEEWRKNVRACNVEPFITTGRDIEASFLNPKYLAEKNHGHSEHDFAKMIEQVLKKEKDHLVADYVNGRVEITRKSGKSGTLNPGQLAVEAQNAVNADPNRFAGKPILRALRAAFQGLHKANLTSGQPSPLLRDGFLAGIANKLPKTKSPK